MSPGFLVYDFISKTCQCRKGKVVFVLFPFFSAVGLAASKIIGEIVKSKHFRSVAETAKNHKSTEKFLLCTYAKDHHPPLETPKPVEELPVEI